jgi:hypothetical protein
MRPRRADDGTHGIDVYSVLVMRVMAWRSVIACFGS